MVQMTNCRPESQLYYLVPIFSYKGAYFHLMYLPWPAAHLPCTARETLHRHCSELRNNGEATKGAEGKKVIASTLRPLRKGLVDPRRSTH